MHRNPGEIINGAVIHEIVNIFDTDEKRSPQ